MPSQHRHKRATWRPDPERYERAKQAVAGIGSNMHDHLDGFLRWINHETDELPERPPAPVEKPPERS